MKYCPVCQAKYEDGVSFCATDGEVLEEDSASLVGATLDGQYHIEALLGKGGMGAVYRARHILLGDRVAIKVLPPEMRNNAEWLRRFRREGQAARRFRHPNAVTVYDLRTTSEGLIYMVMEFVEGHTLDAELKARGRFTPQDAVRVMEPVMSVLNAAHAMGVVHRDLKPENIMIGKPGEDGQPVTKLLDLGIAKMREVAGSEAAGTTALTVAGQVLGTPFYMSPEQWGEVPGDGNMEIDGRADIYSLGCVFYELLAGKRAFGGLTLQELRREHVSQIARPLQEFVNETPEAFSRAIARAMSKERDDRQATAGELANELRAALGEAPLSSSQLNFNAAGSNAQGSPSQPSLNAGSQTAYESPEARNTNPEIISPTIMTLDAPPRPQANPNPPPLASTSLAQPPPLDATSLAQPPPSQQQQAPSYNTGYQAAQQQQQHQQQHQQQQQSAYSQPNVYNPAQPAPPQSQHQQQQSYTPQQSYGTPATLATPARSKSSMPIIAAVMGVVLLAASVGGFFLWRSMNAKTDGPQPEAGGVKPNDMPGTNKNGGSTTGPTTPANAKETVSYWLEIQGAAGGGKSARVAGIVPLASGQRFRWHFTPRENGYLYIIGPGDENKPYGFLTAKPDPASGVTSNEVKGGVDFGYPQADGTWITLDKKPGTENYTIVFSPTQLSSPSFLAAAGRPLTDAELKEWEDFKTKFKANAPVTDVINGSGVDPIVSIKIPQSKPAGEPVIFDMRIEHK
ncbi:MAG: eukaryotic-like serine/threonine-protein kinase [Blastocatellia bacterium]|jgi:serine/threonine-protein kinase|nr:eukaryotic-like serine/threonine-protein kinase [Blastocatellia bacterium]